MEGEDKQPDMSNECARWNQSDENQMDRLINATRKLNGEDDLSPQELGKMDDVKSGRDG